MNVDNGVSEMSCPGTEVTFLLPIKLPAPYLAQTLHSLLAQDSDAWRLTVVFDGPSGHAKTLVESLIPEEKLRVTSAKGGTGISGALNTGLALIETKYTARIDADDVCHPSRVRMQIRALESPLEPILVCSSAELVDESGTRIGTIEVQDESKLRRSLVSRNQVTHSSATFRTEEVRAIGGYNSSCDASEDYDLWLRCARVGHIAAIQRELISYRISDGQISRRPSRRSSRLYIVAGQVELGASLGLNLWAVIARSIVWAVAQEPAIRNRFGRLRGIRR